MNKNVRAEWYVFYTCGSPKTEMVRIASDCLGDAMEAALQMAERCNLNIVGITPDLGVYQQPKGDIMYRQKGFKNPYPDMGAKSLPPVGEIVAPYDIFEAGADAMLEALTSQTHQDWLATIEGEPCNGKWVFIPDD